MTTLFLFNMKKYRCLHKMLLCKRVCNSKVVRVPRQSTSTSKSIIVRSSRKPEEIIPILKDAIDHANEACVSTTTVECAIKWDEVDELTKAYRKAVEAVDAVDALDAKELEEETVTTTLYNFPPVKNANSWDVLL